MVALIAAVVVQIVGWATQGFGPTDGAYASVYVGWTGLQALFVLGLALLARDDARDVDPLPRRAERASGGRGVGRRRADRTRHREPLVLVRPTLEAMSFYAVFFAGLAVIAWVVLYLL